MELDESITESLDAEPELLPVLDQLFAPLEELGARVAEVHRILCAAPPPAGGSALDLGCGKGAVLRMLCRDFRLRGLGIDGYAPFVEQARQAARAEGLDPAGCRFEVADIRERVDAERDHDLVCLLALGMLLGDTAETVGALRRCVRPGGLILIDDAWWDAERAEGFIPEGSEPLCPDRQAMRRELCAHGDVILMEQVVDEAESRAEYERVLAVLEASAERVAAAHPELAPVLQQFVLRQTAETELLEGPVVGAQWLLRRGEN